jgi:hypothetical protein
MRGALVLSTAVLFVWGAGCKGTSPVDPWCSDQPHSVETDVEAPTWHEHIEPLVRAKCQSCHTPGGLAPLDLTKLSSFSAAKSSVLAAVTTRRMPPFLASPCCTPYFTDRSLTDAELGRLVRFIENGAPEGDPARAPVREPPVPLLSRVDATLQMPGAYSPKPPEGSTDDNRCFALEWPADRDGFITGLAPRPGNRAVVHHLIVAALEGTAAEEARNLDLLDPLPGFDCNGGLGRFQGSALLGGSLVGGDMPRGIGNAVKAGSTILLNIHYSTSRLTEPQTDLTAVDFKIEPTALKSSSMVLTNPAWFVSDGMKVRAGDGDASFFYSFKPHLFTGGKRVALQGVTPHMHHFGNKVTVRILRADGSETCLLDIPNWEFGWEQPYWFAAPILLEPEDRVYVECRFDNSPSNQPFGRAPRDFSWGGNDQDMCAAFLTYTDVP